MNRDVSSRLVKSGPSLLLRPVIEWLVLMACVLVPGGIVRAAEAGRLTEHQLKAAYLLKFPKYVEWPPAAFADGSSPIVLTVIADKAVEAELRRMSNGRDFNGRGLVVRSANANEEIQEDSQVVLIGPVDEDEASAIIAGLAGRHVLTVGAHDSFLRVGGMINLARRDRRIRLEIDLVPVESAGLRISSKLLGVAEVVKQNRQ